MLKIIVIMALIYSLIALFVLLRKAMMYGKKSLYAKESGSRMKGILYAFGRGMMPWEKESVRIHFITCIAGMTYHAGIFGALVYLALLLTSITIPNDAKILFQVIFIAGGACGIGLFLKRIFLKTMRAITCPDDYASNIIVDIFIIVSLLHSLKSEILPVLYSIAVVMFLYIPSGKIRHCFFFFATRTLFGMFFGRRNVFPQNDARFGA
ncbi:MAG: hypothetical protein A2Y62_01560 [Candidatus Fischerbacteria bacterium RBG_13_37_8]|uniref:NarG-like domain-containing protein n=1 Tax=Candidatus Fischerbacteria bacterium RBG_13_37_8 TaxID=1817863 RepID=A0A1F5VUA8_9BACT|nr:MAG: hypothetical protein A2Y62_01560 [Candidatus Fischerbacteria bacterium RBG_13_37_8]